MMDRQDKAAAPLNQRRMLLVYTAVPGTESYEKLKLLSVLGAQEIS